MNYVIGILAGVAWGAVGALINNQLLKRSAAGGDTRKVYAAFLGRTFVDVFMLLVVILVRRWLPFSYEMALVGTAGTLGLATTWLAFRHAAGVKTPADKGEEKPKE